MCLHPWEAIPGFNISDSSRCSRIWAYKRASNEAYLLRKILYRVNATQRWRFFSAHSTDACFHYALLRQWKMKPIYFGTAPTHNACGSGSFTFYNSELIQIGPQVWPRQFWANVYPYLTVIYNPGGSCYGVASSGKSGFTVTILFFTVRRRGFLRPPLVALFGSSYMLISARLTTLYTASCVLPTPLRPFV
jgi:hypothetical protein